MKYKIARKDKYDTGDEDAFSFQKPREIITKVYKWVYIIFQVLGIRKNQFHTQNMIFCKILAVFRGAVGHFELILEKNKEK